KTSKIRPRSSRDRIAGRSEARKRSAPRIREFRAHKREAGSGESLISDLISVSFWLLAPIRVIPRSEPTTSGNLRRSAAPSTARRLPARNLLRSSAFPVTRSGRSRSLAALGMTRCRPPCSLLLASSSLLLPPCYSLRLPAPCSLLLAPCSYTLPPALIRAQPRRPFPSKGPR